MSYKKNRQELINEHLDNFGYIFCQHCGKSNAFMFECHHIVFRSEMPNHPNLHDKENLIIVADDCHDDAHGANKHQWRADLIKERGLTEIFGNSILPKR